MPALLLVFSMVGVAKASPPNLVGMYNPVRFKLA